MRKCMDDQLAWTSQVDFVLQKVHRKLGALRRASRCLNIASRRLYYLSVIQPDLLYGSTAYLHTICASDRRRIETACKSGVRTILSKPPWEPSSPLFQQLQIYPIFTCMTVKQLSYAYRFIDSVKHENNSLSPLFTNFKIFVLRSSITSEHTRTTRGNTYHDLALPQVKRFTHLFTLHVPTLWNTLPSSIRFSQSLHGFRTSCFKASRVPCNKIFLICWVFPSKITIKQTNKQTR